MITLFTYEDARPTQYELEMAMGLGQEFTFRTATKMLEVDRIGMIPPDQMFVDQRELARKHAVFGDVLEGWRQRHHIIKLATTGVEKTGSTP